MPLQQLASDVNDAEEAELRRLEGGAPPPPPAARFLPRYGPISLAICWAADAAGVPGVGGSEPTCEDEPPADSRPLKGEPSPPSASSKKLVDEARPVRRRLRTRSLSRASSARLALASSCR